MLSFKSQKTGFSEAESNQLKSQITFHPGLYASEKEHEIRQQIATIIMQAASNANEIPGYIKAVLQTGIKILVVPKTANPDIVLKGIAGKYSPQNHTMVIIMPDNAGRFTDLEKNLLPHEFWHAYQVLINNKQKPVEYKSPDQAAIAMHPFSSKAEQKELGDALAKGIERVKEFRNLLGKKQSELSSEEESLLNNYRAAVADYQPNIVGSPVEIEKVEGESRKDYLNRIMKMKYPLAKTRIDLFPKEYVDMGDKVIVYGILVQDERDTANALVNDILHREAYLSEMYTENFKKGTGDIAAETLTESDAFIAQHPKKLNEVFFPERLAFHAKRSQANLKESALVSKQGVFSQSSPQGEGVERIKLLFDDIVKRVQGVAELNWRCVDDKENAGKKLIWTQGSQEKLEKIKEYLLKNDIADVDLKMSKANPKTGQAPTPTLVIKAIDSDKIARLKSLTESLEEKSNRQEAGSDDTLSSGGWIGICRIM